MRKRYAVIPTTGREILQDCLDAICPQVDQVILIAHNCVPEYRERATTVWTITYGRNPPNISEMWNIGLDAADEDAIHEPYDVAVLNDDAIVPSDWFDTVTTGMRETGAAAGSVDQFGMIDVPNLLQVAEEIDLRLRMSGYAFILDGRKNLRLDEQFQWWYGDDDLDWRARMVGGVVRVPGTPVTHLHGGASTVGELATIAGEDGQRFQSKWGRRPW